MAAAYTNLTAASSVDLLQKIVSFLTGQGWANRLTTADGNAGLRAHLTKGGYTVNFRASTVDNIDGYTSNKNPCLAMYLSTGFDGGQPWDNQPGAPLFSGMSHAQFVAMPLVEGSFQSVWLFDDGADNITVVVEPQQSVFQNLGFGLSLTKAGGWSGGAYCYGSAYRMQANVARASNGPIPFGGNSSNGNLMYVYLQNVDGYTGWSACGPNLYYPLLAVESPTANATPPFSIPTLAGFAERQFNSIDGTANLLPIRVYLSRNQGDENNLNYGTAYSLLGEAPSLFVCNATDNGAAVGDILTIGSDSYVAFPGYAVKKRA